MEHAAAGTVQVIAPFFRLSETPGGVTAAAPLLGEHTEEVLRDRLGLGPDEIRRLRQAGALGRPGARPLEGEET